MSGLKVKFREAEVNFAKLKRGIALYFNMQTREIKKKKLLHEKSVNQSIIDLKAPWEKSTVLLKTLKTFKNIRA